MSDLKQQLKEDKAIRGAARSILAAQIAQVRQGLSGHRIGEKIADTVGDPMLEKIERVGPVAKIAGGIAAAVAFVGAVALTWKPVMALLESKPEVEPGENDDDA